jgi:hypothetical protein
VDTTQARDQNLRPNNEEIRRGGLEKYLHKWDGVRNNDKKYMTPCTRIVGTFLILLEQLLVFKKG